MVASVASIILTYLYDLRLPPMVLCSFSIGPFSSERNDDDDGGGGGRRRHSFKHSSSKNYYLYIQR
ncbi:hypothetical protein BLOT_002267 [Blomia tropicalis]|nr:hypothetical protein BLOT_002267 [Blomia tropicalis]